MTDELHISRSKINETENILRSYGVHPNDVKEVMEQIGWTLLSSDLYLNIPVKKSIIIDPIENP